MGSISIDRADLVRRRGDAFLPTGRISLLDGFRISHPNLPEDGMRKLSLDLDGIRVETFETDATARAYGTVHGRLDAALAAGDSPLASCVHSCEDTICFSCDPAASRAPPRCARPTRPSPSPPSPSSERCSGSRSAVASAGVSDAWMRPASSMDPRKTEARPRRIPAGRAFSLADAAFHPELRTALMPCAQGLGEAARRVRPCASSQL